MTIDLRQLRHLLALADQGSFGRAAAALEMTQPALSRSMQGLERQVGAALFERSKRGVVPTDEGRVLIVRARALVHAADELDREVLRRKVPGAGQISIGAGPYPGETILPAALAQFGAAYPLLRVRVLLRGDWDELLRRLRARELDFLACETSTLEGERDLEIEPLPPHPLYFVARHGHALTRRARVRPANVFAYPLLALSRIPPRVLGPLLASLGERDAKWSGIPFPAVELTSLAALKRLLADTDATAPLTLPCVAEEVKRGTLALLLTESWLATSYGLVTLKGQAPGPAAQALLERLREAEAALVPAEAALIARYARPIQVPPGRRKHGSR
jgi:DNA-binding transcriptional LysR family regulator